MTVLNVPTFVGHELIDGQSSKQIKCTCGAQAYREKRKQERQRMVAPMGGLAGMMAMRQMVEEQAKQKETEPACPTPKRSLWRRILGKGPKCTCLKDQQQNKAQPLRIPSEYVGCERVRVAGKRVAFTRDMQLRLRESYTPLDSITETDLDPDEE